MSILEWIAYYIDLLPIIIFVIFLFSKKKIMKPLWVILFYCIYSFANNTKLVYAFEHNQKSTIFLYLFTVVEYVLFAIFIYSVLQKDAIKRALLVCSILFIGFCLFNIFFKPQYQFDSLHTSIESIILLIFCIMFLFEQINIPETIFIYSSYKFWVIIGILVYLAATFFLYGFAASLPTKTAQQYWVINHISNILRNLLFVIAIIVYVKTPKNPKPMETGYQPFLN